MLIDFVDSRGVASQRVVTPFRVGGGDPGGPRRHVGGGAAVPAAPDHLGVPDRATEFPTIRAVLERAGSPFVAWRTTGPARSRAPHASGSELLREDFLDRADVIDGGVRALLAQLDLTRTDADHERMIDALMGVSRAADALRALAADDDRRPRTRPRPRWPTTRELGRIGMAAGRQQRARQFRATGREPSSCWRRAGPQAGRSPTARRQLHRRRRPARIRATGGH